MSRLLRRGSSAAPSAEMGKSENGAKAPVANGNGEAAVADEGASPAPAARGRLSMTGFSSFKSSFRLGSRSGLTKSASDPHVLSLGGSSAGDRDDDASSVAESTQTGAKGSRNNRVRNLDRSVRVGDWSILCSQFSTQGPRHANEDRMLFSADAFGDAGVDYCPDDPVSCFGVMDGHGGPECAQYCAERLVHELAHADCWQRDDLGPREKLRQAVGIALESVERIFLQRAVGCGDNSGACVVFGAFSAGNICVANIGDCRAALHDAGTDFTTVTELTRAHRSSNPEERRRIEEKGGMVVNNRAFGVLEPSRTIGDLDVKVHCPGAVVPDPHFYEATIHHSAGGGAEGACLVMGSDGVWDVVQTQLVVVTARKALKKVRRNADKDPARAVVKVALRNGTMDDATAMVLEFS